MHFICISSRKGNTCPASESRVPRLLINYLALSRCLISTLFNRKDRKGCSSSLFYPTSHSYSPYIPSPRLSSLLCLFPFYPNHFLYIIFPTSLFIIICIFMYHILYYSLFEIFISIFIIIFSNIIINYPNHYNS